LTTVTTATPSSKSPSSFFWFRMQPWQRIFSGLILGLIAGFIFGEKTVYIKPIGDIFINAIMMLIVPVVFTSLVCGVISMKDPAKMGRVGIKTLSFYMVTMVIATTIGLSLAMMFSPGSGITIPADTVYNIPAAPSLLEIVTSIIPYNPVVAFAESNVLQIIVFAIMVGIAINMAGDAAKPVVTFLESFLEIVFKLVGIVMSLAPYGVFALMAWVTGQYGLEVLKSLFMLVAVIYLGCIINMALIYTFILRIFAKLDPRPFFKGMISAQVISFTTGSSAATLPVSMQCAQKHLGVSKELSSFIQPLGATINMNGLSVYLGAVAIFAANMYGIFLTPTQLGLVIVISTLASIGCAGIPGAGLIVMSLVLGAIGLPFEVIAIIAAVDRIIEMATTTVNITGDALVATVIAKSEGDLDETIYYSKT